MSSDLLFPRVVVGKNAVLSAIVDVEIAESRWYSWTSVVLKKGQKVQGHRFIENFICKQQKEHLFPRRVVWGTLSALLNPWSKLAIWRVRSFCRTSGMTDLKFGDQLKTSSPLESVSVRQEYVGVKDWVGRCPSTLSTISIISSVRHVPHSDFDDGEAFTYFQLHNRRLMEAIDFIPDVLHARDYHTAMIPFLIGKIPLDSRHITTSRWVVTIHNLNFRSSFRTACSRELFGVGYERYADGTPPVGDDFSTGWRRVFFMRIAADSCFP